MPEIRDWRGRRSRVTPYSARMVFQSITVQSMKGGGVVKTTGDVMGNAGESMEDTGEKMQEKYRESLP